MDSREASVGHTDPGIAFVVQEPPLINGMPYSSRHVEQVHAAGAKPMTQRLDQSALTPAQLHSLHKSQQNRPCRFFRHRLTHRYSW
jgi:hypothetical protein